MRPIEEGVFDNISNWFTRDDRFDTSSQMPSPASVPPQLARRSADVRNWESNFKGSFPQGRNASGPAAPQQGNKAPDPVLMGSPHDYDKAKNITNFDQVKSVYANKISPLKLPLRNALNKLGVVLASMIDVQNSATQNAVQGELPFMDTSNNIPKTRYVPQTKDSIPTYKNPIPPTNPSMKAFNVPPTNPSMKAFTVKYGYPFVREFKEIIDDSVNLIDECGSVLEGVLSSRQLRLLYEGNEFVPTQNYQLYANARPQPPPITGGGMVRRDASGRVFGHSVRNPDKEKVWGYTAKQVNVNPTNIGEAIASIKAVMSILTNMDMAFNSMLKFYQ
jgi:hypothetical protein